MPTRFLHNERGSVAVVFGLALLPILMASAAAIEYSRASSEQAAMKGALDGALLAAAKASDVAQRETIARSVYGANSNVSARSNERLTFWTSDGRFYGRAEAEIPLALGSILQPSFKLSAQSAVGAGGGTVCVLLVAPSGQALTMGSSSQIVMPGCEVHVRSSSERAVVLNSSAAVIARSTCVAGTIVASNVREGYYSGCKPIADVWAEKMPVMAADTSCRYDGRTYNNRTPPPSTLVPGTICNGLDFGNSAQVTFSPGVYRVRGGGLVFAGGSRVIAEGVTFYFEDAQSSLVLGNSNGAGNVRITMTPPSTGVTAGIMMFEAPGLSPSNMTLVSAGDLATDGLFYLPSRNLTLNSSSAMTARKMNVVARTASFTSSSTWQVDPVPQANLRGYNGGIALVE